MKLLVLKGRTSLLVKLFIQDSSSTTGAGLTGLAFNTASLVCYRARDDDGNAAGTAISLATMTRGTWATGGFVEKDATNMPGVYEFGVPNAAIAAGSETCVLMLKGAANMAPVVLELQLTTFDIQAAIAATGDSYTRLGAPAGASISADIAEVEGETDAIIATLGSPAGASLSADVAAVKVDTAAVKVQTDKLAFTVTNQVDANVLDWKSATAPAMTGDAYARLGAPAGASTAADIAAIKSDTGTILTDVNTGAGAIYTRIGAPAGASVSADVAAIKAVLPTALTGAGNIKADMLATNGDATSAANVAKTTRAIGRGTVNGTPSTTSIPTSSFTPAGAAADQFKGRIITFDADTTTTSLRGQSTDITANTNAGAPTFTVTALTTAPAVGDTFSVT